MRRHYKFSCSQPRICHIHGTNPARFYCDATHRQLANLQLAMWKEMELVQAMSKSGRAQPRGFVRERGLWLPSSGARDAVGAVDPSASPEDAVQGAVQ